MDEYGWAGRLMVYLRYATQVVVINLLWVLGTAAGLGILGAFPASRAATRLLMALLRGQPSERLVGDFWDGYRNDYWRSNLLGVPFWVLAALGLADLQVFRLGAAAGDTVATALLIPFILVVSGSAVALAFLLAVGLRFDDDILATWRFVFLAPFFSRGTSLAILLTVGAFLACTLQWPILVPLVGFSAPILMSTWLAGRRLEQLTGATFLPDPLLDPPVTIEERQSTPA